jgi:hypothetical protein
MGISHSQHDTDNNSGYSKPQRTFDVEAKYRKLQCLFNENIVDNNTSFKDVFEPSKLKYYELSGNDDGRMRQGVAICYLPDAVVIFKFQVHPDGSFIYTNVEDRLRSLVMTALIVPKVEDVLLYLHDAMWPDMAITMVNRYLSTL